MTKRVIGKASAKPPLVIPDKALLKDVRALVDEARRDVAHLVNSALVLLYWRIGRRVRQDILKEKRAEYGKRIVSALGRQLEVEFGSGFSEKSLRRMIQFAEVFPDEQIVASLMRQLSWTHFTLLIPLKEPLQREFYAEMCRIERWSVRTLRQLEENEQKPEEDSPIGLILCAGKSEEQITLLRLDRGNIRVAAYMTELIPKKLFQQKLHAAIRSARDRLGREQIETP